MEKLKIFFRYFILLILAIIFPWFYFILSPITIFFSGFVLQIFIGARVVENLIIFDGKSVVIVFACVALYAYLLLLILNLSVKMDYKKRVYSILFSVLALFIANVFRIVILSLMYFYDFYFEFYHQFFWTFLSTVFVIIIWFSIVKLFKIKEIPFYSDLRTIKR